MDGSTTPSFMPHLQDVIGFMMIKYEWGIGKAHWFKAYPFAIVAINILIAVASDFESASTDGIPGGCPLKMYGCTEDGTTYLTELPESSIFCV